MLSIEVLVYPFKENNSIAFSAIISLAKSLSYRLLFNVDSFRRFIQKFEQSF
ncbi:hypothetical protein BCQ_2515 [Bacillus cereus Q1]|uniref:Uncharacterized protein n=1 Tax=Bacillus cereus (strain Q1) TaxID=361100 RepID=B9J207_BACCQ|nr:hypothetical protein BCQ_2515 [Bacillus cereus Q1]